MLATCIAKYRFRWVPAMTLLGSVVFQLNVIRNSCYCGSALLLLL
ncbi:unnamed protein product [Ectocarpus sp. 6 AP-2014]